MLWENEKMNYIAHIHIGYHWYDLPKKINQSEIAANIELYYNFIIRKTKCSRIFERNVPDRKTKRSQRHFF